MSSHIHELWEELDLPQGYPEVDPDAVLARVDAALGRENSPGRPTMKRKLRFGLILAAALILLSGAALAAAQQAGVLDLFFQGDTGVVEPFVQTAIDSVENGGYRLTVNSALYDGQNVFAVFTVEGLTPQAADDLMSNRANAEAHRMFWGEDMVKELMDSGSLGPDGLACSGSGVSSCTVKELPAPSDTSRCWQADFQFPQFLGPRETPLTFWLAFMGKDCAVSIPLDTMVEPIRITPNEEVTANPLLGLKGILKELILTPASFSYTLVRVGDWSADLAAPDPMRWVSELLFLRMRDGTVLTANQLGALNRQFERIVDLTQVESIIFGYTEFPADGSPSRPAKLDPRLYPFTLAYPAYQDTEKIVETKISLRLLCQGLGAEYQWDENTQTATAVYRGVTVSVALDSTAVSVDGRPVEIRERSLSPAKGNESGGPLTAPNPVSASDHPEDLLVPLAPLEDAWDIQFYWNRLEADDGQGDPTLVSCGYIVIP